MSNVLILSAGGRVARHVVDRLKDNTSVNLTLYLRDVTQLDHLINLVKGDILDATQLNQAMQGKDIVYVNINGQEDVLTERIIEAMQAANVKRLVSLLQLVLMTKFPERLVSGTGK